MCLILCAYDIHPRYRLILAANRDEFYDRPTKGLAYWDDTPKILAGRDLKARGTWLGVTGKGRLAAITNYREPHNIKAQAPSRGGLVTDFLIAEATPRQYCEQIAQDSQNYNGFNLILGDADQLCYCSNRSHAIVTLEPGYYGLSNHLLDTPWPKVEKGKTKLQALLKNGDEIDLDLLFALLHDQSQPPDQTLPDTGVGMEWERILAPLFIQSPVYGTRSSSIILIDRSNQVTFVERTYDTNPTRTSTPTTRSFTFKIEK